jgi:EmrB/QacA subfamily drug resistance transporter
MTCCISLLIVGVDNTTVNVALPSIKSDLGLPVSGLQWTIDAYTLVLASLLMLAGSIADRIGRRRVFQTGLITFAVASALCSLAPSLDWLIAFRVAQALGGCMLNPVALSIITNTFTEPKQRARAIGLWGAVVGVSMALGPVLGGSLIGAFGWRAIFWINVPICLGAALLAAAFIPESKAPRPRRVDPVGQGLVLVMLASLTYAVIESPTSGWGSPRILTGAGLAVAALIGLLLHQPRREEPLLDLRFFRSAPFTGATVIAVSGFAAAGGFLFLNSLYLQDVRGFSALQAGLYTLPMAVMTIVSAPLSGRLVAIYGPRRPLLIAGTAIACSGALLSGLNPHTPMGWLMASYVVFGVGFGMVNAPITTSAVSGMPRAQAGVAAAIASTSRMVGQSLGVAVVGSAAASGLHGAAGAALAAAGHAGWWIIAGCGGAVFALGALTTGRRAKGTTEAAAALSASDTATPVQASPIGIGRSSLPSKPGQSSLRVPHPTVDSGPRIAGLTRGNG